MKLFYLKYRITFNLKERFYFVIILFSILFLAQSCIKSKRPGLPENVIRTINNSGINRTEFLKTLVKFQNPEDSLKLKAAYYLISNVGSHYYAECKLVDSAGKVYNFDFEHYSDTNNVLFYNYLRLIYKKSGELKAVNDTFYLDIYDLKHEILINSIEKGFYVWQNKLYEGESYPFDIFCENILPYRVDNEPLEDYRNFFESLLGDGIKEYTKTKKDFVSIAGYIHFMLENKVKHGPQYEFDCDLPKLETLIKRGEGNYRQMSIFEVKAFRTFGIASTLDYSPFFANGSGGYYWPSIILPGGSTLPLIHEGKSLKKLTTRGKLPKVFRRIFFDDSTTLFRKKNMKLHTPPFIGNFNYIDVTDEYTDTRKVNVSFNDTSKYVYLSVFNNGEWHPVHWAEQSADSVAEFTKMGIDIVYMPTLYYSDKVKPSGDPFILTSEGKKVLNGKSELLSAVLGNTNKFDIIKSGKSYHLYIWKNNRWEIKETFSSGTKGIIRINLNPKSLYILTDKKVPCQFCNERIFVIDKYGNQRFY